MDLGIIGYGKTGKTTVFNALTSGHAETAAFGRTGLEPNIGVVKVPDPRLDRLAEMDRPRKVTPAEIRYLDLPGDTGLSHGEGIGGAFLNLLTTVDALIHVVRAFEDPSLPHPMGSIDPARDIEAVNLELAYSDAAMVERRLERIATTLKAARPAEREAAALEQEWLTVLKAGLEEGRGVREATLDDAQRKAIANYALLTAKPLLVLLNIGEDQIVRQAEMEAASRERFAGTGSEVLAICGKLEMELAQMEPEEAREFREAMGITEPGLGRVIRTSYALLGFISFFTTGPDESRAWTIPRGALAPQAAGKIHSDMERGFIRAEVVSYPDLVESGGWNEARKKGLLRVEGKGYQVQDGDVMHILFSR